MAVALRAHAAGLLCAVAAVELLIGHAVWLCRTGFVDRFVAVEADSTLVAETPVAWVDWQAASEALEAGSLPCSASEGQILRIAASIGGGVALDLGAAVTGLDAINSVLVVRAVLVAGGHREVIDGLAGVAR